MGVGSGLSVKCFFSAFLFNQMALAPTVVIQTEKREPFAKKARHHSGTPPYLADSFGIFFCVQEVRAPASKPGH